MRHVWRAGRSRRHGPDEGPQHAGGRASGARRDPADASSLAFGDPRPIRPAARHDRRSPACFGMEFNDAVYPDAAGARAAADATREALRRVPGVKRVAMLNALPDPRRHRPAAMTVDDRPWRTERGAPTAIVTAAVPTPAAPWACPCEPASGGARARGTPRSSAETDRRSLLRRRRARDWPPSRVRRAMRAVLGPGGWRQHRLANTDRTAARPPRVWIPMMPEARRLCSLSRAAIRPRSRARCAHGRRDGRASGADRELQTFDRGLVACDVERLRRSSACSAAFAMLALLLASERPVRCGVVHRRAADRRVRHTDGAWRRRVGRGPPGGAAVARVGRRSD